MKSDQTKFPEAHAEKCSL